MFEKRLRRNFCGSFVIYSHHFKEYTLNNILFYSYNCSQIRLNTNCIFKT